MANHYFKERDSYFKLVDETNEVICITTIGQTNALQ